MKNRTKPSFLIYPRTIITNNNKHILAHFKSNTIVAVKIQDGIQQYKETAHLNLVLLRT